MLQLNCDIKIKPVRGSSRDQARTEGMNIKNLFEQTLHLHLLTAFSWTLVDKVLSFANAFAMQT